MSSELLIGLCAGALALGLPLLLKLLSKLRGLVKAKVEAAIESPVLENVAVGILETVLSEAQDAISKVLTEAAARAKDGKLDDADKAALLALLKEETIGEVRRQLSRLKK
jgi:hypothetical protein